MAERPYRRKQYLVDRPYQLRFVTRVFIAVFAVGVCSAVIALSLLRANIYSSYGEAHVSLIASFIAVASTLFLELCLAIPLVWILGIRHTHRIVGPMNRLRRALDAIGEGDYSQRITLRKGDALEDLAASINKMAENLQQRSGRPGG